jgi:ketosteroid isomerase-like protein
LILDFSRKAEDASAGGWTLFVVMFLLTGIALGSEQGAASTVAALDTQYQAAVKANDYLTMDKILADDFVLVRGTGEVLHKSDLIDAARGRKAQCEHQEEIDHSQKVRVWGDTAVVTAKLWIKCVRDGRASDRKLWFSDTYVRTASGWRYVLGQASIPLPGGG